MNEFSESHSISKIVGAPPGYVGYENTRNVLDEIRDKPNSVLILDEIEKCNKSVLNLFLKGIEEGNIKDSRGRIINFENLVIIMTTNIDIEDKTLGFNLNGVNKLSKLKNVFGTSFINELTKVIVLNNISENDIKSIILRRIEDIESKYNVSINIDNYINELIKESEYEKCGAKKVNELIRNIEDYVIEEVLRNNTDITINSLSLITN